MAQPPSIRSIVVASGLGALADVSTFIQQVADALSGRLTHRQNHAAQWVDLEFSSTVTTQVAKIAGLRTLPVKGVSFQGYTVLEGRGPTAALGYTWAQDRDSVRVTLTTPPAAGSRLKVTFLVVPE